MSKVSAVTYDENFAFDTSSKDCLLCDGVFSENGVLRGTNATGLLDERTDYTGLVGVSDKYLFAHTNRILRRYDGESFTNLMLKMPVINPVSSDVRSDVYRNKAYVAFDDDGVIKYEEGAAQPAVRWAFHDSVEDVAVVNERVVILTGNGNTLRFSPCNERLYSDGESAEIMPSVDLPCQVQAITRFGYNVLYALGNVCYKVTFSADEADVKFTAIASGLGKVIRRSVAQIGDKIIFASVNGLYVLRGDNVTPVFSELNGVICSFENCRASAWRGRYVLSVPCGQETSVYVLDVNAKKCVAMLNRGIADVCGYNGTDVAVTSKCELVRFLGGVYRPSVFVRSNIRFNSVGVKFLRRLNVTTKYDLDVAITDGSGCKRVYRVKGKNKPQSVRIFGKGEVFGLEIRSLGRMEVTKLSLSAETYKEEYYGG